MSMSLSKQFNGRLFKTPSGHLGKGNCTCCKCVFGDGYWGCPDIGCITTEAGENPTVCCYSKNDTMTVTLGTITAGAGPYDPGEEQWVDAVAALVADISGRTFSGLKNCFAGTEGAYTAIFRYDSPAIYSDSTYVYGYWLTVTPGVRSGVGWGPFPSPEIYFNIDITLWRATKEDYYKSGVCSVNATILLITTNGIDFNAPQGSCCQSDDPIPMRSTAPHLISSVGDSTDVVITSECDLICSCSDLADSYLVETDCGNGTVTRTPSANVCEWSFSGTTGAIETCDLVETSITLRHSYAEDGFCGWVLEVSQAIYGLVGESCEITEVITVTAHKTGGASPVGTYTVVSGTGCGTTIEVS